MNEEQRGVYNKWKAFKDIGVSALTAAEAIQAIQQAFQKVYPKDYEFEATCFSEGDSGNCGVECRVFLRGDCSEAQEVIEREIEENDIDYFVEMDELPFLRKSYPHTDLDLI